MPTVNLGRVRGSTIYLTQGKPIVRGYADDWAIDPDTGDLYHCANARVDRELDQAVWEEFIQAAGAYYRDWDADSFGFPLDDRVVKDVLRLRGDDNGTVITADQVFAKDPDAYDLIIETMDNIALSGNGGDYISTSDSSLIKAPTWAQFQYCLIHRKYLPRVPDELAAEAEAREKYSWHYYVDDWALVGNLKGPKGDRAQGAGEVG